MWLLGDYGFKVLYCFWNLQCNVADVAGEITRKCEVICLQCFVVSTKKKLKAVEDMYWRRINVCSAWPYSSCLQLYLVIIFLSIFITGISLILCTKFLSHLLKDHAFWSRWDWIGLLQDASCLVFHVCIYLYFYGSGS